MKKIALLTSGTIVLLGGLFYGLSLNKQRPSQAPLLEVAGSAKPPKTAGSVPPHVNGAPPDSSTGNVAVEPTAPAAGTRGTGVKPEARRTADIQEPATRTSAKRDSSKPRPADAATAPSGDEPAQSQAPVGLRLAPDVRLPVAAMPLNFKVSPVAKKAVDQIVADYYRQLASSPPQTSQRGNANAPAADLVEESETGELTRVITNGPAVDAARKYADYRFKALFGNDAYNRMTMNTLLEARTPVTPRE